MSVQEFHQETLKKFELVSDAKLLESFNREVGNQGWGSHRGAYLAAIHMEFLRRNFDISEIGNERELSFKKKVELVGKKLIPIAS